MKALLLATVALLPFSAEAAYVKLQSGHEVYVEYQAARPGRPTFVLVNGLVYNLSRWNDFARPLAEQGYGIVSYYFRGQLKTLRRELESGKPEFFRTGLVPADFATEIRDLMDALRLPKAIVVGLSYGAAPAATFAEAHPERVEQLLLMAPLVVPLDRYDANGAWIRSNLDALRLLWGPLWGPYVYDQYYNWIFRSYLNQRLGEDRIPAEMADVKAEYQEALFHQVRAFRDFDLKRFRFEKLAGRVHYFLASGETEPALKDQFSAWERHTQGGSLTYLSPAWHAIPDAVGERAAALANIIARGDSRLAQGRVFYLNTERGERALEEMTLRDLRQRALAEPRGED